jgi:predicted patatin/cPLA2 family phospholipase
MGKTLIVQGGGFRTGFTAGILDAFISLNYFPFDRIIGISGGAISSSYYLTGQFGSCVEAMRLLASDPEFVNYKYIIQERGYMNIDHLAAIANEVVPFDITTAMKQLEKIKVHVVVTNRSNGAPHYLTPNANDWIDIVIASSTLPFVTKGVQKIRGVDFMDGGWSDPLPVKWAIEQGDTDILILRTTHLTDKIAQSWPDYLGSLFYSKNPELSNCFAQAHDIFNHTLDYIAELPSHIKLEQIWPEEGLKCATYSYSVAGINTDYRYGLQLGLEYARRQIG